ncbi:MAG TPA: protein kinase [Thermoanaerobaculia bacterium]|nr:protein kinase [Thermoanaerobaculia bacterium]
MDTIAPGSRLGPYEVIAPLGAGGMGEVWRARDTRLDRSVALKVLPASLRHDTDLRARFDREARTISQLNHPNICTLHDVGDDFIVMELLDGESLADRIARGPLPVADVVRFGTQIAAGLEAAHRRGVVHRDLKPANVMITRSVAKVLDFGLAKGGEPVIDVAHDGATQQRPLTREGTILGTFQYMAPEQLEDANVDHRADIFALGSLLYEMATARRAFEGKTKTSLIAAIVAGDPRPMRDLQPLAPVALEQIVLRCLAKDPEERWQSASDVRHALELIAVTGTASVPETRTPRRWLVPALAALALAALTAAAWLFATRYTRPPERLIRASILPPGAGELGDLAHSLSISPDAAWVTFRVAGVREPRLWVRRIDGTEARPLPGTETATMPMWSPDSREIAFFTGTKLKKVTLDGSPPVTICDVKERARRGVWTSSGEIIFAVDSFGALSRVSVSGGTPVALTKLDATRKESTHRWPEVLPDGRHFLYLGATHAEGANSDLHAIFASSFDKPEERKLVLRARSNVTYARGHLIYARADALVAQPFDASRLELTGEPFVLANSIQYHAGSFLATFAASPDGTIVYRTAPDASRRQLAWIDAVASSTEDVPLGEPDAYRSVRLSEDGKRAVYEIEERETGLMNIWIDDLATRTRTRLTPPGKLSNSAPVWSPDGTQVAFTRGEAFGGGLDIWIVNADGTNERRLTNTPGHEVPRDWAGDSILGTAIKEREPESIVTRWNVTDGTAVALAKGYEPSFSSDGTWILYGSESPDPTVWLARASDGSSRKKIAGSPAWPKDWIGSTILYTIGGGHMRMIDATTTPASVTLGAERAARVRSDVIGADTNDFKRWLGIVQKENASNDAISLITNFTAAAPRTR